RLHRQPVGISLLHRVLRRTHQPPSPAPAPRTRMPVGSGTGLARMLSIPSVATIVSPFNAGPAACRMRSSAAFERTWLSVGGMPTGLMDELSRRKPAWCHCPSAANENPVVDAYPAFETSLKPMRMDSVGPLRFLRSISMAPTPAVL